MTRIRPGRTNAPRFPREEEFVSAPNKQLQRTVEGTFDPLGRGCRKSLRDYSGACIHQTELPALRVNRVAVRCIGAWQRRVVAQVSGRAVTWRSAGAGTRPRAGGGVVAVAPKFDRSGGAGTAIDLIGHWSA